MKLENMSLNMNRSGRVKSTNSGHEPPAISSR